MKLQEKFYAWGGIFLVGPVAVALCGVRDAMVVDLAAAPALLCFMSGYITWWAPKFLSVWKSDVGRVPLVLLNGALLPLCAALGRFAASAATGLPAQSVDLTVGFLALLSYPVLWGGFLFLVVAVEAFASLIVAITLSSFLRFVRTMISLILPWRRETTVGRFLDQWMDRGVGGLVSAMLVGIAIAAYASTIYSSRDVRLLAYGLDFGYASKYPLVDHRRRMRLLDNQYAAYAEFKNWDVKFVVEKLEDKPAANCH